MSSLVPVVRAVVREELKALRATELGVVSNVRTKDGGDNNIDVDLLLRGSALELLRVPVALSRLGLSAAPQVEDLAVVSFVGGDLNSPVVLGFLYDEQTRPPDAAPDEVVYEVPDSGSSDARRVEIKTASGHTVTLLDDSVSIVMGSTTMTVEADGDITLESGANLALKATGSLSIEAGQDVTIKGLSVTAEGQTEAKLKGVQVSIAGLTNFSAS